MNEVEPKEQIYTDYKDHERHNPTNIKLKTTVKRIRFWGAAHEEIFTEPALYEFGQDLITLKHKDRSKRNLIVKFHLTTGVVVNQGSRYKEWESKCFNALKNRVNDLCMYEIPLHVRSNADHNDHDSDMTATKQVMNAEGALSDNDSVVISEREDDASNSEDEMIGDRLPANSDINTNYDPINKLEGAYVKLIDSQSNNIEALKMELAEVKSEVRKIPNKLHDSIKKYLDSNTKILQDVLHQLAENEDLKNQISHITSQLQSKSREIWSKKREAANYRSHSPSNNYRSRIPTSNVGVAQDHIRQSPVSCHTAAPTQAGTSPPVHIDAPSQPGSAPVTHNATSNQGATTSPTPGTTRINHPQHAPPSPLLPGPGSVAHDATLNRAATTSPVQGATRTDRPQHAVSSP